MDPFVPKGQPRTPGDQTCGYKPASAKEHCGQVATWHVMWGGDLDNSFTCDEHMNLIQRRWMYDDRHPVVADCGMPGALWKYNDNRCQFPAGPLVVHGRNSVLTPAVSITRNTSGQSEAVLRRA
ncbi:hypothetical protein ACFWMG_04695 [Streptomyces sp. NPDC127074]|uniref:hypothetical protein n=1 Tax=Streptomyces sp. NPDC127074 TaxID=3347130 RepID=UPI00364C67CE